MKKNLLSRIFLLAFASTIVLNASPIPAKTTLKPAIRLIPPADPDSPEWPPIVAGIIPPADPDSPEWPPLVGIIPPADPDSPEWPPFN